MKIVPGTIVLLMNQQEAAYFTTTILSTGLLPNFYNPVDIRELMEVCRIMKSPSRLISFCSSIIVPRDILRRFSSGALNFHPGPPEYRGSWPSAFALRDKAKEFGVTLHTMATSVDSGPIHAVRRFMISEELDRTKLDAIAYKEMLQLTQELKYELSDFHYRFSRINENWSGPIRSRKDL